MLLIGAGALLLFVSLFLDWYEPGLDAWTVFEVWDLVLALLAIGALAAVAGRLGFGPPRPASWIVGPAVAMLVIVLYALLDPPPAIAGIDGDPRTGLWLALAAATLIGAGGGDVAGAHLGGVRRPPASAEPSPTTTPPTEPTTRPL